MFQYPDSTQEKNKSCVALVEDKPVLEEKTQKLAGKNVFDAFVEVFDDPFNLPTGITIIREI